MLQSSVSTLMASSQASPECDCLAHRFGNAGDRPYRRPRYPSDMSDVEWAVVRDAMPVPGWLEAAAAGRRVIATGRWSTRCATWSRAASPGGRCPRTFPPGTASTLSTGAGGTRGLTAEFHDRPRARVREAVGRDTEPTAGIIDAQSVKAAASVPAATRGFDGGKKVKGRKRHIVVDTLGLLLAVMVTAASATDRDAGQTLLARLHVRHWRVTRVWADGGYTGRLVDFARDALSIALTVVRRVDDTRGFR